MTSSKDGGSSNKNSDNKKLNSHQKTELGVFFKRCPNPNENQQAQLAKRIGLQLEQVKEWFENMRPQTQLQAPQPDEPQLPTIDTSRDIPVAAEEQNTDPIPAAPEEQNVDPTQQVQSPAQSYVSDDVDFHAEKERMLEIASEAHKELSKLLLHPCYARWWFHSSYDQRITLNGNKYDQKFLIKGLHPNVFKTPETRVECSRSSTIIQGPAIEFVEALFNPEELVDYFPTMIRRAEVIKEYEAGLSETKSGALILMYLELHTLSPQVPPRKYFILRYCLRILHSNIWLVTDVSLPSFGENLPHLISWKRPSGCLIENLPNNNNSGEDATKVVWIEHVEVNDKPVDSLLYEDLLVNNVPYSADMMTLVLQRSQEKFRSLQIMPHGDLAIPEEGRISLLNLSHRMLREFSDMLNTTGKPEIAIFSESNSTYGAVKFYLRPNSAPGCPIGMIASIVTSFWVPQTPLNVFNILRDATNRSEWDDMCDGGQSAFEVANIPTGISEGNCLSVIRLNSPYMFNLNDDNTVNHNDPVIFQESSTDAVHSYIVFAPIDSVNMHSVLNGTDLSDELEILPSGFSIIGDTNSFVDHQKTPETLLTFGFQVCVYGSDSMNDLKMESLVSANTIFRTTINKIKTLLDC